MPPPSDRAGLMTAELARASSSSAEYAPSKTTSGTPPSMLAMSAGRSGTAAPGIADMLDIEAAMTIEVTSVTEAAIALRGLARSFEAVIVEDTVREVAGSSSARLTARVPSQRAAEFVDALGAVGRVRSRQITARDIGKEFFDAELRLQNLQATMARYEEILKQAKDVNEILRVESELGRLRAEIEQIKGNLRWLSDRAARATVHVDLALPPREVTHAEIALDPQAKMYPGLRVAYFADFAGDRGTAGYAGGGVSVALSRKLGLRLDGLRDLSGAGANQGLDVVLLTLGGETYSDFLGGGKRSFLNPYLGWTLGYARFLGTDQAVVGASLGVEMWKTKNVSLDADLRGLALFLGPRRSHAALEPSLSFTVAF